MNMFRLEGLFSGGIESVIVNFMPLFAFAYGGSNAEIGVLVAAMGLGAAAACLPGAWLSERWKQRLPFILLTRGLFANLCLLALALLPLFVAGQLAVLLIVVIAAARSFTFFLSEGAWTSLAADVSPASMRGRYFASRNLLLGLGGLVTGLFVGGALSWLGMAAGWAVVWGAMLAFGIASSVCFVRIPEDAIVHPKPARSHTPGNLLVAFRDQNFVKYAGTVVLWSVSIQAAVPFFNVHLVKNLGASSAWVSGLVIVGVIGGLAGQFVVGRLMDLRGTRWLMGLSGVAIVSLPWAWFFVTAPYQVVGINVLGGVLWSAYLLASFSFLLAISPPGQERYYAASYHTVVFMTMVVGPLLGGAIAAAWGIKWVFFVSGAGRLAAVLAFIAWVQLPSQDGEAKVKRRRTTRRRTPEPVPA